MNYRKLRAIDKLYFGYPELARALGISIDAARVTACRYVRQGYLVRLKRNVYVRTDQWEHLSPRDLFALANVLQTPSYVSLMTALCHYEISTQMQRNYVESIAVQRTKTIEAPGVVFSYFKVSSTLYGGFVRHEGYFIAEPERAYVDALYLSYCGQYSFDRSSLDYRRLNQQRVRALTAAYPERFLRYLRRTT